MPYSGAFAAMHLLIWRKKRRSAKRKSPLTTDLLRPAGYTVRQQLEDVKGDMFGWLCLLVISPLIAYSVFLTDAYFIQGKTGPVSIELLGLFVLCFFVYGTFKLWRLAQRREQLSIGLDAEMAVGEELNHLMRFGATVFHDVPAEGFNIDHVVVSPTGVYAVETKGRAKMRRRNGKTEVRVEFDGKALKFPTWTETEPIAQAERQAKWLQRWLSSAVGDAVQVHAVLVLPGWFVERRSLSRVRVLNGREVNSLVRGPASLSDEIAHRIAHQLDQRCRTVPRALTAESS